MNPIKEAFLKIKEDILFIKEEINEIQLKLKQFELNREIKQIQQQNPAQDINYSNKPTNQQTNKPTNPTHNIPLESLYSKNIPLSIGNEGVPTDKQTNRQTDKQIEGLHKNPSFSEFKQAEEILNSLDNLKKEIRLKFKHLTTQEILVFSILYGLEEQKVEEITYKTLSNKLNLSESSIRDYINKLIKKGIPINKIKQNNKIIFLEISKELKKIATLATILKFREI